MFYQLDFISITRVKKQFPDVNNTFIFKKITIKLSILILINYVKYFNRKNNVTLLTRVLMFKFS